MFWALQCPSSGARQTAVAASGFRMNVEVRVALLLPYSKTIQYFVQVDVILLQTYRTVWTGFGVQCTAYSVPKFGVQCTKVS